MSDERMPTAGELRAAGYEISEVVPDEARARLKPGPVDLRERIRLATPTAEDMATRTVRGTVDLTGLIAFDWFEVTIPIASDSEE